MYSEINLLNEKLLGRIHGQHHTKQLIQLRQFAKCAIHTHAMRSQSRGRHVRSNVREPGRQAIKYGVTD